MSLLRDIQNDLANNQADTTTVLRKCKILAARLKSQQFSEWVDSELNGYAESKQIPEYRILTLIHYASFANSAWRIPKSPIPLRIVPEKYRDAFTSVPFKDGIAKAVALCNSKHNIVIAKPDLVPAVNAASENMICQEVWAEIPVNEFHQLLSAVKNRILDFVLKLESENPDAGEALGNSEPIPAEKLRPLVQNIFYGSSIGAIAQNSEHFTQTTAVHFEAQDVARLATELAAHIHELNLDPLQKERAQGQIAILKTESTTDPDIGIVKQAARSIRNITEGAIGSLLATAAQPPVWHWIQQTLAAMSK